MLAVVKMPRIDIKIRGDIPRKVLKLLKDEYGSKLHLKEDQEYVDFFETSIYKKAKKTMIPGTYVRIYRENHGLTQPDLGGKLGISKAYMCDIEKGRRSISKVMAKKLSNLFSVSVSHFI